MDTELGLLELYSVTDSDNNTYRYKILPCSMYFRRNLHALVPSGLLMKYDYCFIPTCQLRKLELNKSINS